jgi:hypothetical protein
MGIEEHGIKTMRLPRRMVRMACIQFMPSAPGGSVCESAMCPPQECGWRRLAEEVEKVQRRRRQ